MDPLPQDLKWTPVDRLRPHPLNSRRTNLDALRASIRRNGFYGALVANKRSREILVGQQRWSAARRERIRRLPVLWIDVDHRTALRILLVDNRSAELASSDSEGVALALEQLSKDDPLLSGSGYSLDDYERMIARPAITRTRLESHPSAVDAKKRPRLIISLRPKDDGATLLAELLSRGLECALVDR